jgi:hypothetical protein
MEYTCGYPRQTLEEAGYQQVEVLDDGQHVLLNTKTGKQELWGESPNFAGYALSFGDTELEFCSEYE